MWSDGVSGTLTLNQILKLFLFVFALDLLENLGRSSDDLLVLLDLGGEFLDSLLSLLDLSGNLRFLDLKLLDDNRGSFSLDHHLNLVSLLGKLFNSFELSFLLIDLLLTDFNGGGSDILLDGFWVLFDLLLEIRLDLVDLEFSFLGLSFKRLDKLVDLSLLSFEFLELLFSLESLLLVEFLGHLSGFNTFLVLLENFLEGNRLLVQIQRFFLLLVALVLNVRNLGSEFLQILFFLFNLLLSGDSGLHINEFVVEHLRIDFLEGWFHGESGWFDGAGHKSSFSLVGLLLHLNDVLVNLDNSSRVHSDSCQKQYQKYD